MTTTALSVRVANAPCSWGVIEGIEGERSGWVRVVDEMSAAGYAGKVYRTPDEIASWKARDPIATLRAKLLAAGALTEAEAAAIEKRVCERLDAAFAFAANSPWPSFDQLTTDVYA